MLGYLYLFKSNILKMKEFKYPNGEIVYVSDATVEKTSNSFNINDGIFEPDSVKYFFSLVEMLTNNHAVILDIGAQSGLYSLYAKFLPNCYFVSFEPFKETYDLLLENCKLNSITNIQPFNIALGAENTIKQFQISDHNGLHTFGENPTRFTPIKQIPIQVHTLDTFFSDSIPIDFIKIDTEGWEYYVLKGAEMLIQKWKPHIFMEVNCENMAQCSIEYHKFFEYLKSLHYYPIKMLDRENIHFAYYKPNETS